MESSFLIYQLAILIGFFLVFLATYFIWGRRIRDLAPEALQKIHDYNRDQGWRIMFWSELLPAGIFFFLLFFVPHSPRWLMMKGRDEQAKRVLAKITIGPLEAEREYQEIVESLRNKESLKKVSVFCQKSAEDPACLELRFSILQQVTGINAILYYGACRSFSKALGYGPEDALKQQVLLGAVDLGIYVVAIYQVDKWGRKPLLILGTTGMLLGIGTLDF